MFLENEKKRVSSVGRLVLLDSGESVCVSLRKREKKCELKQKPNNGKGKVGISLHEKDKSKKKTRIACITPFLLCASKRNFAISS